MTPREQAISFYNQAMSSAIPAGDMQMAYRLLSSATTVDPTFATGLVALGNACADLKLLPAAVAAYQMAVALPDGPAVGDMDKALRVRALVHLGHRLYHSGRLTPAALAISAALILDGDEAFAYTNLSMVQSAWGADEAAIDMARKGWNLIRDTPISTPEDRKHRAMVQMGLAFALLFDGQIAEGLEHFEARFDYTLQQYDHYPFPRWKGEKVEHLFVMAEQGAGDSLCFSRFFAAARARCDRMTVYVQRELVGLFERSFPDISFSFIEDRFPIADVWCPIVSLPHAMGMDTAAIAAAEWPFFTLNPWTHPFKRDDAKLHVGIAWKGSSANEIDRWRSLQFTDFLRCLEVPGVQLYSLQVGEAAADLHTHGVAGLVREMTPFIREAGDTMAIMRQLDLVISVESFPVHLAAAAGVECWVPVSYMGGDWRVGRSRQHPIWAPQTRLFRQGADLDWRPVWQAVADALRERVS